MSEGKEPKADVVKVNLIVPSDMRSSFANHFVVRHSPAGECNLLFFEIDQPIFIGEAGEDPATEVDAHCVSKVVVTKQLMGSIIAAMAENFTRGMALESSPQVSTEDSSPLKDVEKKGERHAG